MISKEDSWKIPKWVPGEIFERIIMKNLEETRKEFLEKQRRKSFKSPGEIPGDIHGLNLSNKIFQDSLEKIREAFLKNSITEIYMFSFNVDEWSFSSLFSSEIDFYLCLTFFLFHQDIVRWKLFQINKFRRGFSSGTSS